jgi:hypothetical protein
MFFVHHAMLAHIKKNIHLLVQATKNMYNIYIMLIIIKVFFYLSRCHDHYTRLNILGNQICSNGINNDNNQPSYECHQLIIWCQFINERLKWWHQNDVSLSMWNMKPYIFHNGKKKAPQITLWAAIHS